MSINYALLDIIEKYEKELKELVSQSLKEGNKFFTVTLKLKTSTVEKLKGYIKEKNTSVSAFIDTHILAILEAIEKEEGKKFYADKNTALPRGNIHGKFGDNARVKQLRNEIEVLKRILDREM